MRLSRSTRLTVSIPYMGKVDLFPLVHLGYEPGVSIPYMGKVEQHFVDVFYYTPYILLCQPIGPCKSCYLFSYCYVFLADYACLCYKFT